MNYPDSGRLRISKIPVSKDGSTVRRYGMVRLNFCQEVRYAGMVRFFCNGTGTLRWYAV